jgi:glutaredoxin-related protein
MKITMYGAPICPECVEVKKLLDKREDIEVDYKNIIESTKNLKEFLAYRDKDEMFAEVTHEGRIGIPFFILEDGKKTFDLFHYLEIEKTLQVNNTCSIDGSGQC